MAPSSAAVWCRPTPRPRLPRDERATVACSTGSATAMQAAQSVQKTATTSGLPATASAAVNAALASSEATIARVRPIRAASG